ncbi:AI-2E family transporter [Adlercreutzia sp. ZJ138]|uniref:AI-2E family transporter n=1 Tax=Adlercreutzia sp. ZJ138 TaxID=2709405 RepID=UPI0013EDC9AA|nr:AI-2E family transporter [Adlercreutzia sp. ZJ138]
MSRECSEEPVSVCGVPGGLDRAELKARTLCLRIWSTIGAVLLLLVAAKAISVLHIAIAILILTVIIVFCLRGPVNSLERRGMPRFWATAAAFVLMFVVVACVCLLMFSPAHGLIGQVSEFVSSMPARIDDISALLNQLYERYSYLFQSDAIQQWGTETLSSLSAMASELAKSSANGIVALGAGLVNAALEILFALVVSFWILLELPGIGRECNRLVSDKHREEAEMLHITATRVMSGFIRGTLLQSAIVGVCSGVWFAIIGMPSAAVLGVIMTIVNIVPVIGPWVGGIILAVVGVFDGVVVAALAVLGFVLVHCFVATVVYPRIMQGSVDAHPALVLVALMVGSALGGAAYGVMGTLVGMLFSIPIVAMAKSVFVYYFEKRTGRRIVAPDGVFFKGGVEGDDAVVDPMADATAAHPVVKGSAKSSVREVKRKGGDGF